MDHYHYDVMGGKVGIIYMETSCFRVFMFLNYMKAYVSMYFLHLMLSELHESIRFHVHVFSPLKVAVKSTRVRARGYLARCTVTLLVAL